MMFLGQRKLTFTIQTLVIGLLGIGTLFLQSNVYAMGYSERIEGTLLTTESLPNGTHFGGGRSSCVIRGIELTGLAAKAISYNDLNRGCYIYRIVQDVVSAGASWCSQWVFPTNANPDGGDECYQTGGPTGGGGGGEGIAPWEPPPITFPDSGFCGGGPSYSIYEDFKIVVVCGHAPRGGD